MIYKYKNYPTTNLETKYNSYLNNTYGDLHFFGIYKDNPKYFFCECVNCGVIFKLLMSKFDEKYKKNIPNTCRCKTCLAREKYSNVPNWYVTYVEKNAIKRGINFNLTIEQMQELYLKQNKKCKLSNVDLSFAPKNSKNSNTTASLDRINSSKGYVIENVQWLHKDVNMAKQSLNQREFIKMCETITFNKSELVRDIKNLLPLETGVKLCQNMKELNIILERYLKRL